MIVYEEMQYYHSNLGPVTNSRAGKSVVVVWEKPFSPKEIAFIPLKLPRDERF
jgi:hypothetical protein